MHAGQSVPLFSLIPAQSGTVSHALITLMDEKTKSLSFIHGCTLVRSRVRIRTWVHLTQESMLFTSDYKIAMSGIGDFSLCVF
jgi:hypothetical protein